MIFSFEGCLKWRTHVIIVDRLGGDNVLADILVEVVSKTTDKTFTYRIPDGMKAEVGMRALVPFGPRKIEGFIIKIYDEVELDYEVKDVIKLVDEKPVLNKEMLELGRYISKKTLSPLTLAYQTMLPRALKAKEKTNINKKTVKCLRILKEGTFKNKHKLVFDYVKSGNDVLKSEASKISVSSVNTLIKNGYLEEFDKEVYRLDEDIEVDKKEYNLTYEQKKVLESVKLDKFKPYLLHGVTGSGKTLVYIKLIEEVLKKGKEAILLVPNFLLRKPSGVLKPNVSEIFKKVYFFEWERKSVSSEASVIATVDCEMKEIINNNDLQTAKINVARAAYFFSTWLIHNKIHFQWFEEADGRLSNPDPIMNDDQRLCPLRYEMAKKNGMYSGENPYITKKWVKFDAQVPGFHDSNAVNFDVVEEMRLLSKEDQESLLWFFYAPSSLQLQCK